MMELENINNNFFCAVKQKNGEIQTSGERHCILGQKLKDNNEQPQGVFVEWYWDGNSLIVYNDYSGYYPLFYYYDSEQIMVSGSIAKLISLGTPAAYDELALASFCRCGFFIRDHTPFKRIKVLPPNSTLRWSNGNLELSKLNIPVKSSKLLPEQIVDGYINLFSKAVKKRIPSTSEFVLPLTGGRDSRQILLELNRQNKLPKLCLTCGEDRDRIIAKKLSESLNLTHYNINPQKDNYFNEWEKNILTNFCALEHGWLIPLTTYIASEYNVLYEGTGVGIFTRSELVTRELYKLYNAGEYRQVAQWLYSKAGPPEALFELLPSSFKFVQDLYDDSVDFLAEELEQYTDLPNPLGAFNFWNWNRRSIALMPFSLYGDATVFTPFLDYELFSFVASLPFDAILNIEPQTLAIKKAFPGFADIPFYNELKKTNKAATSVTNKLFHVYHKVSLLKKHSPHMAKALMKTYFKMRGKSLKKRNKSKMHSTIIYMAQLDCLSSQQCSDGFFLPKY